MTTTGTSADNTLQQVDDAIQRTHRWFLEHQDPAGFWVGELEGDSILQSEYLLLLAWLTETGSAPDWARQRIARCAKRLTMQQEQHGGWSQFPGGPLEISASVKAYLALKIAGHSPDEPQMLRAAEAIRASGGAERVNSFTRYFLALLGILEYHQCPAVPPELVLCPDWCPVNIYEMSAWSRTIFVPLSLLWAFRPSITTPEEWCIDEIFLDEPKNLPAGMPPNEQLDDLSKPTLINTLINWHRLFGCLDATWKQIERFQVLPLRGRAIRRASEWMIERFTDSDGLGAIFPPMVWSVVALKCLGYSDSAPILTNALEQLEELVIPESDNDRLQPCHSPVWDTAIATIALRDSGLSAGHPSINQAVSWLLDREVSRPGDWSRSQPNTPPGGWFFEFENRFYPDVDDTAMVVLALRRCLPNLPWSADFFLDTELDQQPGPLADNTQIAAVLSGRTADPICATHVIESMRPVLEAMSRGARWAMRMQSRNGGWGAFDRNNTREWLTRVPFADHNAMIDPPTADLTARVLEMLGALGVRETHPAVMRALDFLWQEQEEDDSWYGRWGVNYIYGTWQTLVGLAAIGIPPGDSRVRRAVAWLKRHQQPCGGWGETPASYDDPSLRGTGPVTPSQTAWAVMGLLAANEADSPEVADGIAALLRSQAADGRWPETSFTGTGFPRVFYLRYHLYPISFPLMALGRYAQALRHGATGTGRRAA